jgi:hypothetical protein
MPKLGTTIFTQLLFYRKINCNFGLKTVFAKNEYHSINHES